MIMKKNFKQKIIYKYRFIKPIIYLNLRKFLYKFLSFLSNFPKKKLELWRSTNSIYNFINIYNLHKGELDSNTEKSLNSLYSYVNYCNNQENIIFKKTSNCNKSVVLISSQLRFPKLLTKWISKISKSAEVYIYTDKFDFAKLPKNIQLSIEQNSAAIEFSEQDEIYQEESTKLSNISMPKGNIYQWLKLNCAIHKWENHWKENKIKYIYKHRSDVAILNPYILQNALKDGLEKNLKNDAILSRSDLIFALKINNLYLLKSFYKKIIDFYLTPSWQEYPYTPINPKVLIESLGATRVDWLSLPKKYLQENFDHKSNKDLSFQLQNCKSKMEDDFLRYKSIDLSDEKLRKSIFGELFSSRTFDYFKFFPSELSFAHYLASNEIYAYPSEKLFSGMIMRETEKSLDL